MMIVGPQTAILSIDESPDENIHPWPREILGDPVQAETTADDTWAWLQEATSRLSWVHGNFGSRSMTSPVPSALEIYWRLPYTTAAGRSRPRRICVTLWSPPSDTADSTGILAMKDDSELSDFEVSSFGQLLDFHIGKKLGKDANVFFMSTGAWPLIESGSFAQSEADKCFDVARLNQQYFPDLRKVSELRAICLPIYSPPPRSSSAQNRNGSNKQRVVGHWTGAVIMPHERTVVYLDSLDGRPPAGLAQKLTAFISHVFAAADDGSDTRSSMPFQLEVVSAKNGDIPVQTNAYDCGLFMLTNMLGCAMKRVWGVEQLKYSQEDCPAIRRMLVHSLITSACPPGWWFRLPERQNDPTSNDEGREDKQSIPDFDMEVRVWSFGVPNTNPEIEYVIIASYNDNDDWPTYMYLVLANVLVFIRAKSKLSLTQTSLTCRALRRKPAQLNVLRLADQQAPRSGQARPGILAASRGRNCLIRKGKKQFKRTAGRTANGRKLWRPAYNGRQCQSPLSWSLPIMAHLQV